MFNIKSLAVLAVSALHLKGPDDELLFGDDRQPIEVELFGPGSAEYAAVEKRINDRNIARMMKGRGKRDITAEQARADQIEKLVACTKSFSSNFTYGDGPGQLSGPALFEAVYSDREIGFIADQVAVHISDWANFTKSSATS